MSLQRRILTRWFTTQSTKLDKKLPCHFLGWSASFLHVLLSFLHKRCFQALSPPHQIFWLFRIQCSIVIRRWTLNPHRGNYFHDVMGFYLRCFLPVTGADEIKLEDNTSAARRATLTAVNNPWFVNPVWLIAACVMPTCCLVAPASGIVTKSTWQRAMHD